MRNLGSPRRPVSRLRSLLALVLLAALTLLLTSTALAGVGDGEDPGPTPVDKLCVVGTVINHQEEPISGWTITAIQVGPDGQLLPDTAISVETDDKGQFRFDDLTPGVWNFSIEPREGWEPVTPASFDVPVRYGAAGCQEIRFKMRQLVAVNVLKIDADHNPLEGWTITAKPGPGNLFATAKSAKTSADGIATFLLTPGEWIFTESAPPGVNFVPVVPNNATQQLNVTAPGPHTLRFKNRLFPQNLGCIEVVKTDLPPEKTGQAPFGLPNWLITVLRTNGTVAAQGRTDAFGRIVFQNLPLGPYTVREEVQAGWEAVSPTAFNVTLTGPQCVRIEFVNQQKETGFCIIGRKIDANGGVGLPGWEIDASPVAAGGFDPAPVLTDGLGFFQIDFPMNDYRVPGAAFKVCETVQDGWLAHTPTCFTVQLPHVPGACVKVPVFENQQVGHSESKYAKPGCSHTYTVKSGDQLFYIGRQYGVSPQDMLNANPKVRGRSHYILYVGEQICIP